MKITIGRIIRRKEDYDSENINCPIEEYHRTKFLNRRFIIRLIFILLYGFGFGYSIALLGLNLSEIKSYCIELILFSMLSFYLIQIPHEFIHSLFYRHPFANDKNNLVFFNKKRILTAELEEKSNSFILFLNLLTPFILFTILPLSLIIYVGFDIYLYSLSFASAMLCADDLLNIFLLPFATKEDSMKCLYVIPNNYDYLIASPEELEVMNSKETIIKKIKKSLKKR